jgi:hypothetical protein
MSGPFMSHGDHRDHREHGEADPDRSRPSSVSSVCSVSSVARLSFVLVVLALSLAVSALVSPSSVAALPGPMKLTRFEIEGRDKITEVLIEDLDGDGLKDLVLLLGREVRVHFQRAPGIFQSEPDQRFKIDPRAVVMDLGDVFATGKTKQVAFIRDDGVYAYKLLPAEGPDKKPYF